MMELFISLLLFTSSPALGAPVTIEMTPASPVPTSAPDYQASLSLMNSFHSTETHIEETSTNSHVEIDQVTSTSDDSASSSTPSPVAIPPRFKYMEEQLAHKKEDLEEAEQPEASSVVTSTIGPTTAHPTTVGVTSISPDSTTIPIPTLSSQTTHREQEEVLKDSVDLSEKVPTFSGGFLPGPAGFVRKTKKISEEVKQEMMKEMEVKYGPVIDDIQEFGYFLKRKNEELSAEVKSLREKLIKTESELIDAKLVKQMRWMPFWDY